ncbi:Ribosomal protein L4/L1e [Elusimicrobium minutum Pei191]|uniref:Large ribosomal subunit protein uL4 n=1 Tax=Elusimicrobium minutum (strain Pei191) TaxID=445932 RepID=B2KEM0_ELUMP|nr:50S ribosomal protein L4 [Elusimicrobium minutum]ACC98966.1 Ribosomal protein L4/L1e [Elusimicrobium minutum Pei191]
METKVFNIQGKEEGTTALPEVLFSAKPNPTFLHEVVTAFLANQRRGTADVKTRAEVSGTGKKPWKQKGTGRARHGSMRSPIWRHGGVAFGPTPRSFRQYLPAQKRRAALIQALSAKYAEGNVIVFNDGGIKESKTKVLATALKAMEAGRKPLVLTTEKTDNKVFLSARNIAGLSLIPASDVNAYVVLNSSKIIITKDALETLKSTFAGEAK